MTSPLLSVRGVHTYYGHVAALKGVDLDVKDGEIVTLIGANGAGKSTLMMTIFGRPRARAGSIEFDGDCRPMVCATSRQVKYAGKTSRAAFSAVASVA